MTRVCKNTLKLAVFVFTALFFSVCALASDAAVDDVYTIAEFDEASDTFSAGSNTDGARLAVMQAEQGGAAVERSCLEIVSSYRYINSIRSVSASFNEAIDLSEYRRFEYDIYVPLYEHDPRAVYYTRVKLFSSDGSTSEKLVTVEGGVWHHVEADISGFSGRSSIVAAEIALIVDTSVVRTVTDSFYIDSVCASGVVDRDMTSRFLFDKFEVVGAESHITTDKTKILFNSEENSPLYISAEPVMPRVHYPVNCLRIMLANRTDSSSLIINYKTMDSQAVSEDKSVTVAIEPQSEARYYYAYVGDASKLQSFEMIFGEGYGTVELVSISPVHRYMPEEYAVCGEVTACKLYASGAISFSGNVNRDAALAYGDSRIAVYEWNGDALPTPEELADLTSLAEVDMTTRFELIHHISKNNDSVRYSRFIAVVLHADGTYTLISEPFYADNPELGAPNKVALVPDSKGFAANDLSLVADTDSEVTVLVLDSKKFFSSKSEGRIYTYGGCSYYLNGAYLDSVGGNIDMLSAAGVSVLVRLTGWSDALQDELYQAYSTDSYVSYALSVDAVDGTDYLGALSSYIADTWCVGGKVCGVIFGDRENGKVTSDIDMTKQAEMTAQYMRRIYNHIASVNSGATVFISVDDVFDDRPVTDFSRYMLSDYIPALISSAERYGGFSFGISVEVSEEENGSSEYVTVGDCSALTKLIDSTGLQNVRLIFCDSTYNDFSKRLSTLMQNYVLGYYHAYFDNRIDAYIAIAGARGAAVAETVRYIDTTDVSMISNAAMVTMKENSIDELVDGYDEDKLKDRILSTGEPSLTVPDGIKGVYRYFDFDSIANVSGVWTTCYGGEVRVTNDGGSAMTVSLRSNAYGVAGRASWLGVLHNFEYPENFKLTPTVKVTLKVDSVVPDTETEVSVKTILHSSNERFEAAASIPVGEWVTLYIDTKPFNGRRNVESIRLLTGDAKIDDAVLSIKEISGLSFEYENEELAEKVAESREKRRSPDAVPDYRAYYWVGGALLILVATILALVLLSRRRGSSE